MSRSAILGVAASAASPSSAILIFATSRRTCWFSGGTITVFGPLASNAPSVISLDSASRAGVRLTFRAPAMLRTVTFSSGLNAPVMMALLRRS